MTEEFPAPRHLPGKDAGTENLLHPGSSPQRSTSRFSDTGLIRWLIPAALLFLGAVMVVLILVALGVLMGFVPFQ